MTTKGSTQKPKHPPVKNYADYIKDEMKKGRMTTQEGEEAIVRSKGRYQTYDKKTYITCR